MSDNNTFINDAFWLALVTNIKQLNNTQVATTLTKNLTVNLFYSQILTLNLHSPI